MTDYRSFFKNKTVTLMGLGLLGRGVGDAAFLAEHCKQVIVTDMKSAEELRASVDQLASYKNIEFVLGGHDLKNFSNVDFVIKAAGVRRDNEFIRAAEKNNIPVYMSTALFAHLADITTIGITGTRGKTTTTCMLADILKHAGKKILLGGNLRGVSTLAMLPMAHDYDYAVLELDSWQLQGFDSLKISPHIAVFTTFYPDHMNYYDGDMAAYLHDKTAIYRHQKNNDVFVVSPQVAGLLKNKPSQIQIVDALPDRFKLQVPGAHNLLNAALAKAAAKACGVDDAAGDVALRAFMGVEGRLQRVGNWQQREFYNDSNATTQEATLAALKSFLPNKIVLIFGGADKGLPLDDLIAYLMANKIRCVLIKGTGSDRILATMPLTAVGSMQDAVAAAQKLSEPGDHIILSPAFASFGVFKNEYDRSDQFMREVQTLIASV